MASSRRLIMLAMLALGITVSHGQVQPGNCNADDGTWRAYTPPSGNARTMKINCNFKIGTGEMSKGMRPNLGACIDACIATPACMAIDYTPDTRSCIQYAAATKGTISSPGTHNAYINDNPANVKPPPVEDKKPPVEDKKPPVDDKKPPVDDKKPPIDGGDQTQKPINNGGPGPGPTDPKIKTTTTPTCPENNGQAFIGDDGTYYKIQCGYHTSGTEVGRFLGVATFQECMNKCSATNGCISVAYVGKPVDPYITYECLLSSGEGPGTQKCEHWFAYTIDPPATEEDKPFPYTLCETSCPLSDGMIYESDSGEQFKMSCGKRHGTQILWTATMETFDDCMDSCGKILACHSVDYQARTKKCYYGNHHGSPGLLASSFASATSMGCSGACKKSCSCPNGVKA